MSIDTYGALAGKKLWQDVITQTVPTTTANGVNALNSAVLNVVSTAGFLASGTALLGGVAFTYTGKTANTFTGCGNHAATVGGETVTGGTIATTGTFTADVEVTATDWIVIQVDMTGGADADLTVTVQPFEADGITLEPAALAIPPTTSVGPKYDGSSKVVYHGKYDVLAYRRIRITIKNNNANPQTINRFSWRQQGY